MISGLDFLVGAWRGAGVWGGAPFTTEARWGRRGTGGLGGLGGLAGLVVATAAGRTRSETILIEVRDGRATAEVASGPGPGQRFDVHELVPGERYRLEFTPPSGSGLVPQRWTIQRTADGYSEVFEIARSGAFEQSVECAYVPAPVER